MGDRGDDSRSDHDGRSNKRQIDKVYGVETVDEIGWTEVEQLESFTYMWQIKNFAGLQDSEIQSPIFTGGASVGHQWQLRATTTIDHRNREYLGFFLAFIKNGSQSCISQLFYTATVKASFQLRLVDKGGHVFRTVGGPENVKAFTPDAVWGRKEFIPFSLLDDPSRLPNDNLNVHCQIWYVGEPCHRIIPGGAPLQTAIENVAKRSRLEAVSDISTLRQNDMFADVNITTVNKTNRAHRVILVARSDKFRCIFATRPTVGTQNVSITNYPDFVVEAMLDYIYGVELNKIVMKDQSMKLIEIGQEYKLNGLKELGELETAGKLKVENAAELLLFTHTNDTEILKPRVITFIRNHLEKVKQNEEFQKLSIENPQLVIEFTK